MVSVPPTRRFNLLRKFSQRFSSAGALTRRGESLSPTTVPNYIPRLNNPLKWLLQRSPIRIAVGDSNYHFAVNGWPSQPSRRHAPSLLSIESSFKALMTLATLGFVPRTEFVSKCFFDLIEHIFLFAKLENCNAALWHFTNIFKPSECEE